MENKFLRFVEYVKLSFWDTKRYTKKTISSKFEIVELFQCIEEQNKRYKLSEEEKEYGILGVNNKEGIFDAYLQKGKEINQPYKKMEVDWIAYNPYRINVGSMGIRLKKHLNEYISPAYVVFSCLNNLKPEYLFLMFKTPTFNNIINENTTGSVRQNLTFETLKNIQIPLPSLEEQEAIVSAYQSKIDEAQQLENQAQQLENEIEKYLFEELGIEQTQEKKVKVKGLQFVEFKNVEKWGVDFVFNMEKEKNKYKVYKISDLCKISSGGTPSRSRKEYFTGNIPWIKTGELNNEILFDTEEKITEDAIQNSSARLYPIGSLVVAMYGATIGKTAKLGVEATTNQACAVLFDIDTSKVEIDFLWEFIQSQTNRFKSLAYGSAQPNLNAGIISNYEVPLPTLDTQNKIVKQIKTMKQTQKQKTETATSLRAEALAEFEQVIFN